jgi:uncharacterized membrane protein
MRKVFAAAACAAIVGCAGASPAFAGEITGPVGPNGGLGHPVAVGGKASAASPGVACSGHSGFLAG